MELIKCNDEETLHTPIPLKYTTSSADKEKKSTNDSSTKNSTISQSVESVKPTTINLGRKKVNVPKAVNKSEKSLDIGRQKPFRKIHPKPEFVSTNHNISNPIKDQIRQSLLKCQTLHNNKNTTIAHIAHITPVLCVSAKVENKPKVVKSRTSILKDNDANERNREAAKRYRNKQKIMHDKLLMRNAQLEAEVVRLRQQLESFKKAHEKCSVTQNSDAKSRKEIT